MSPGPRAEPSTWWALSEHLAYVSQPSSGCACTSVSIHVCVSVSLGVNQGVGGKARPNIGMAARLWLRAFAVPHEVYMKQRQRDHCPLLVQVMQDQARAPSTDRVTRNLDGCCLTVSRLSSPLESPALHWGVVRTWQNKQKKALCLPPPQLRLLLGLSSYDRPQHPSVNIRRSLRHVIVQKDFRPGEGRDQDHPQASCRAGTST